MFCILWVSFFTFRLAGTQESEIQPKDFELCLGLCTTCQVQRYHHKSSPDLRDQLFEHLLNILFCN